MFDWLFGGKRRKEVEAMRELAILTLTGRVPPDTAKRIIQSARRMGGEWPFMMRDLQIIGDSLHIARTSKNRETVESRRNLAAQTWRECQPMCYRLLSPDQSADAAQSIAEFLQQIDDTWSSKVEISTASNDRIWVRSRGFYGPGSRSLGKQYVLAWRDADGNGHGGWRESGNGMFILAENDNVILEDACLQRPSLGAVADNGNFILIDELFGTNTFSEFFAFDKAGRLMVKHRLGANAFSAGISADGQYAACQCCGSGSSDSDVLAFFDLSVGALLWSRKPVGGWADSYRFDTKKRTLHLLHRDGDKMGYRHAFEDGASPDAAKWEKEQLTRMSGDELLQHAWRMFKESGISACTDITGMIDTAFGRGFYSQESTAKAHRLRGELCEAAGDIREAIQWYQQAISIDESVGIKQRLSKLLKNTRNTV